LYQVDKQKQLIYRGFRLFDAPKFFKLKDPKISYDCEEINEKRNSINSVRLNLKANHIALYVSITSDLVDIIASDNFFSMEPDEIYTIDVEILRSIKDDTKYSKQDIIDSFKIRSLYEIIK